MSGMTAFLVGVGGLSAICYWLITRTQNIGARRSHSSSDRTGNDYSYGSSSGGGSGSGWSIANWFGSDNSSSSCLSDNSGSSSDSCGSGGGDSGSGSGGGDGGGGGGD
jgi:hypothetical protein